MDGGNAAAAQVWQGFSDPGVVGRIEEYVDCIGKMMDPSCLRMQERYSVPQGVAHRLKAALRL